MNRTASFVNITLQRSCKGDRLQIEDANLHTALKSLAQHLSPCSHSHRCRRYIRRPGVLLINSQVCQPSCNG